MPSIQPITEIIRAHETPQAAYDALIRAGVLRADVAQASAIARLQGFFDSLRETPPTTAPATIAEPAASPVSWLRGLFGGTRHSAAAAAASGVYLWGDVGRGKSMLMDLLYDTIHHPKKRRVHFHAFMQDIHARIHGWRQLRPKDDLLARVAKDIAGETRLLFLDEMQVHDITDAAILSRLFTLLFGHGVRAVFTSNRPPQDLYLHGIQREQFLPFIGLIQSRLDVIELRSDTDYRLEQLQAMQTTYVHPLGEDADDFIYASWQTLTQGQQAEPVLLHVQGRRIRIDKAACGVAWLTFAELCERPLGAADYLEIAALFHTLIVQNVPELSPEKRNEAKRFVTLIDTLYEHKVKLIASADAPPYGLYPGGDGSFEFQRTVSRLLEMQSERYLALEHVSE